MHLLYLLLIEPTSRRRAVLTLSISPDKSTGLTKERIDQALLIRSCEREECRALRRRPSSEFRQSELTDAEAVLVGSGQLAKHRWLPSVSGVDGVEATRTFIRL